MGESGLVTVLFTDLVGSTELAERIGDGAADDLRRRHFESLRSVIATTGGDEVKTIGDAVMVTYRGAADAIAGAVGMQQAVDRDNRMGGEPLAMRVGISAGDATYEDGDWFGRPVIEASRLCAEAEGGQILVAGIVRVLAGSRVGHELVSVGELELKGLPEPVDAAEVRWESATEVADATGGLVVPLPAQLERVDAFSFVGRETEAEAVTTAWKEVVAGGRRLVLVTGEPGIGKTRLTSEVARVAHDQGGIVLWGGCEEDLGIPYQPVAEALAHLVRSVPADQLAPLLGPLGGELSRLVPDLARLVPGLDDPVAGEADTERHRLFEAVVDVVVNLSARQPMVLVLDDLHWAGKPTLLLLLHLLRSTQPMQLLVVVTYRDTDLDRRHPLAEALADLRRMPDVERIALTGLDATGVTAFLEAAAGHELEQAGLELARAVQGETEGNPFFVGELLLHLVESGALVQRDGRWGGANLEEVGLPEGVREVIGRRLSRLPEAANEVLTVAAVIGRDFELGLLGLVVDGGQEAALEALEPAEAAGLVRPVAGRAGRYTFDHALVRSTLYEELSTSRRLRLHRDVGRALAARGESEDRLPELARHFAECAALGEVDRAVDYGRRAADRATADLAYEEAAAHLERALGALDLAEPPDEALRCDLLLRRGEVLTRAVDPRYEAALFAAADIARDIGDRRRLAAAATQLSSLSLAGLRGPGSERSPHIRLLDETIDLLPGGDSGERARALAAQATNFFGDNLVGGERPEDASERRRALSGEALDMARRLGDPEVLLDVLGDRWAGTWDPVRSDWTNESLAEHDELIELAAGRNESTRCSALMTRSILRRMVGDREGSAQDRGEATALAELLREPGQISRAGWLGAADAVLGARPDAEAAIVRAAEYCQSAGLETSAWLAGLFFRLRFDQGRLAEFEDVLVARSAEAPNVHINHVGLAALYYETDRLEEARPHIEFVARDDFAGVPEGPAWLLTVAGTAGRSGVTGQLDITRRAYDLAAGRSGELLWSGACFEWPVDLHLARAATALEHHDDADRLASAAVDLSERAGAPTFVAQAKEIWATALAARGGPGDRDKARDLATDALTAARSLGMARVQQTTTRFLESLT